MGQALSQEAANNAHAALYNEQAQGMAQRRGYQTPEFASKIAAGFSGLDDGKAGQLDQFAKQGHWGTPDAPDVNPPAWYRPDVHQRYNNARGAFLANLGGTGNTNAEQMADAYSKLAGQGRIDSAMANPDTIPVFGKAMAASKGSPLFHQGSNGVMDQFTGAEKLNDVGVSSAMQHRASAGNSSALAALHRSQIEPAQGAGGAAPVAGPEGFSQGAIDAAAARYNMDGTLPPMGMGKEGALGRRTILNRAAEIAQASGTSPDEQRIQQIGNKANSTALAQIQKQQTMVGAFEKNFVKNADIALELSAKVDRTGMPLANKWLNAGKRSIAGDPELAAFDQAIKSASNEYAKIISGSMGNTAVAEGEIRKMEEKLNSAQTKEQVAAVISLMKRETDNRMTSFNDEKAQLRATMTGGKAGGEGSHSAAPAAPKMSQDERRASVLSARQAIAAGRDKAEIIRRLEAAGIADHGIK